MEATIKDAMVLEVYEGNFEDDNKQGHKFFQARVYEYGQNFPGLRQLKVKSDDLAAARGLVGKRANIKIHIFAPSNGKTRLTFIGAV